MNKLSDFARWFLSQPTGSLRVPHGEVRRFKLSTTEDSPTEGGDVEVVVVHRQPPFQVELVTVMPSERGLKFPEHRHPHVDSIEYLLGGDLTFIIGGRRIATDEQIRSGDIVGKLVPVRAKDFHGGEIGPSGAAFFSIQKWKEGIEMTSVSLSWEGPEHLA